MFSQPAAVRSLGIGAISLSLFCGLGAAGCNISPSTLLMPEPNPAIATMSLIVDTIPSGAQAGIRDGSSCRTPCELPVTPMGPFMVDFALKDHEPQSVQVVLAASNPEDISTGVRLDPNPLVVRLTAIPRPASLSKTKPVAKKSTTNSTGPETAGAVWPQAPAR
jgi:hypothetical protein